MFRSSASTPTTPAILYYLILVFALFAFFIATRLKDSRVGRAWAAMREDEDIAEGMGVSVIKYKLLAFAMGAAVGCLGGAFFPAKLGGRQPRFLHAAGFDQRAGGGGPGRPGLDPRRGRGIGRSWSACPSLLREFGEFRLHIYGAIIIAIMVLKPGGLIPDKTTGDGT